MASWERDKIDPNPNWHEEDYPEPELEWNEPEAEEGYDCPHCGDWIPAYRQFCRSCGLDTQKLQARG